MVSIEQVEKLLQYADVSYEEARDALNECGGSVLDAIVFLERQGKVQPRGGARSGPVTVLPGSEQEHGTYSRPFGESFADNVKASLKWIGTSFDKLCEQVSRDIKRHENEPAEIHREGESEKL